MEAVREIRDRLLAAHAAVVDEDRFDVLVVRLLELREELRRLYRRHRSLFGQDDVEFLQQIPSFLSKVESFEKIRCRIVHISTREQYVEVRDQLVALLEPLAGSKILVQVNRHIADLDRRVKTFRPDKKLASSSSRSGR